ncbi:hypothetical protein [Bacteroides sp. 51]|uniref:hypothetical protein n=1 Tax=Bacteroides sp. 51 TaxID=2302938 RepID=UPI0013D67801|nr:hypothetical protein [Bacteroides sp. 51]NDV83531.1 hypothetical protein [Bacteroides sp. 51]
MIDENIKQAENDNAANGTASDETKNKDKGGTKEFKKKKKNSGPKENLDKVLNKARKLYSKQLEKKASTKWACIEFALYELRVSYDIGQCRADYLARVDRLLDSRRYENECKAKGIDSFSLATHVVFDGKTSMYCVLDNGLSSVYRGVSDEMKNPVIENPNTEIPK